MKRATKNSKHNRKLFGKIDKVMYVVLLSGRYQLGMQNQLHLSIHHIHLSRAAIVALGPLETVTFLFLHSVSIQPSLVYFLSNNEENESLCIQPSLRGLFLTRLPRLMRGLEVRGGVDGGQVCVELQPHPRHCGVKPWQPALQPVLL